MAFDRVSPSGGHFFRVIPHFSPRTQCFGIEFAAKRRGLTLEISTYMAARPFRAGSRYSPATLDETVMPGVGYQVDYRHVVESLRRKPGAFANCKYKDQLFPTEYFRLAYERLRSELEERRADKEYLEILSLAAGEGEEKVSGILQELLASGDARFTMDSVKRSLRLPRVIPPVEIPKPSLSVYDALLSMAGRAICLLIH